MLIHEFSPLWLTLDRIGPFQERIESIDFTDAGNEPCNIYLLLSRNGRGKTTALEVMASLMEMLGHETPAALATRQHRQERRPFNLESLDRGSGRAQWDLRVRYSDQGMDRTSVLSLIAGEVGTETSLRFWGPDELAQIGASEWHRFGFCRNDVGRWDVIGRRDEWIGNLSAMMAEAVGESIGGFEESSLTLPTLIYFSAYRNVVPIASTEERSISAPQDWNYRPVHAFRTESGHWKDSLDNLLVWLKWLDDGRFDRALNLVNKRVFEGTSTFIKGIRKEPPEAIVVRDAGGNHRLDALSSGEKSLVQLFLRLGAHMTRNTILLIDEPEAHLHDQWKFRFFFQLKKLIQDQYPGLTVIVATHSTEMMTAMGIEQAEQDLRKGGYFFQSIQEEEDSEKIKANAIETYGNI